MFGGLVTGDIARIIDSFLFQILTFVHVVEYFTVRVTCLSNSLPAVISTCTFVDLKVLWSQMVMRYLLMT